MSTKYNMRVLLFSPYYSFSGKTYVFHKASIPYNLLYLQSYLAKHKIECKVYELGIQHESDRLILKNKIRCGLSDGIIYNTLCQTKPSIVGISSMFSIFHDDIIELTKLIHFFNPMIRVVVGGNHASCFPDLLLKQGVDQVVVGEGEEAFLDICKGNVDSIVKKPLIKDLDTIPVPRMEKGFFAHYNQSHNPFVMREPVAAIVTSRGCTNNCIYCTVNGVWGRSWRGHSPKYVVNEIKYNMREYGVKEIHFLDDNVSADPERWEAILDLMIAEKLDIKWATPMAYWTMNCRILNKMKQAGCYRLSFGIESGDLETRKFIGKSYNLVRAKQIIEYANKIGLWTISTNIIGFPYETREQIQNTIKFSKKSGVDFSCFFNLIPHASSRVYPYFIKEGLISEKDDIMSIMNEGGCDTKYFTKGELKLMQKKAYSEFIRYKIRYYILHPLHLVRKIHSLEDLRYMRRLFKLGFSMAIKTLSRKVTATSKDFIYGKRQYV